MFQYIRSLVITVYIGIYAKQYCIQINCCCRFLDFLRRSSSSTFFLSGRSQLVDVDQIFRITRNQYASRACVFVWYFLDVYWMYPEGILVRYTFSIRSRRYHYLQWLHAENKKSSSRCLQVLQIKSARNKRNPFTNTVHIMTNGQVEIQHYRLKDFSMKNADREW